MQTMHKSFYNRYVDWRQMPEGDREEKLLIAPTASVLNVLFSVVLDLHSTVYCPVEGMACMVGMCRDRVMIIKRDDIETSHAPRGLA